jgi:hypothetical protein
MLKGTLSSEDIEQNLGTTMIPPEAGHISLFIRLKQFIAYAAVVSLIIMAIELAVLIGVVADIRHILKNERIPASDVSFSVPFEGLTLTTIPSAVVTMPVASPLPSATMPLPPTPTLSIPAGACGAVVVGNDVPLYSGPASTYEVQEKLYNGQGVAVVGRTETYDWLQVFSGRFFGWVFAASITIPSNCAAIPVVAGH